MTTDGQTGQPNLVLNRPPGQLEKCLELTVRPQLNGRPIAEDRYGQIGGRDAGG